MTYNQSVMTTAHALYQANGGRSRDLFAACLSIAHKLVKQRSAVVDIRAARSARISARVVKSQNPYVAAA